MKQLKFIFTFFLLFGLYAQAQTPERFKNHRVGKNETLNAIIEQYGISDDWFASNHISLSIRSTNNVDSLNASTAAAIGMWELTK